MADIDVKILKNALAEMQSFPAEECPEESWLFLYLSGTLSKTDKAKMEEHLAKCGLCRSTLLAIRQTKEIKEKNARIRIDAGFIFAIPRFFLKPLVFIPACIAVFFIYYGNFVFDSTIIDLKTALEEVTKKGSPEKAGGINILFSININRGIAGRAPAFTGIFNYESAVRIIDTGEKRAQIRDISFFIEQQLESEELSRGNFLAGTDEVYYKINKGAGKIGRDLLGFAGISYADEISNIELKEQISKAIFAEENWKLDEAVKNYTKCLEDCGKNISTGDKGRIKLKLAYCLQKNGKEKEADRTYGEILKESKYTLEARVAEKMKWHLKKTEQTRKQSEVLFNKADKTPEDYFKIAGIYLISYNYEEAVKNYEKAAEISKDETLSGRALFNIAWCKEKMNKLEEAAETYKKVKGLEIFASYEIAGIYLKKGDFIRAIKDYEDIAEQADKQNEKEICSLSQFQAGYCYYYDLNDPVKAEAAFYKMKNRVMTDIREFVEQDIEYRLYADLKKINANQENLNLYLANKKKEPKQKSRWKTQEEIDREERLRLKEEESAPKEAKKEEYKPSSVGTPARGGVKTTPVQTPGSATRNPVSGAEGNRWPYPNDSANTSIVR